MSVAAKTDLRPLFHVFGIIPQNPVAVQNALLQNNISSSLIIYNRLQEYLDFIPENNDKFIDYALTVYPNLYSSGPTSNPDYGVGWHYQKSLTYAATEAQERIAILQDIIDLYYPNGQPMEDDISDLCCILDTLSIDLINDELLITGGTAPYNITIDTADHTLLVSVIDFDECQTSAEFSITSILEPSNQKIKIFPNPTSDKLYIQNAENTNRISSLQLFSTNGQLIKTYPKTATIIDLSALQNGIYLLKIVLDDQSIINKRVLVFK